jgi:hypothetical protein
MDPVLRRPAAWHPLPTHPAPTPRSCPAYRTKSSLPRPTAPPRDGSWSRQGARSETFAHAQLMTQAETVREAKPAIVIGPIVASGTAPPVHSVSQAPERIGDARRRIVERRHNGVRFGAAPAEELRFRRVYHGINCAIGACTIVSQEISSVFSRYSTTLASA